ncbi:MAG: glycosyltransferase [Myxococcales bacterium]|nr:glycosyltransferase [Myxococcales bacterium]
MRIGILTDYPVVTFANGPSLATQALKRYLEARGHAVTLVGPRPGPDEPHALPGSILLDAMDFDAHPGVRIPLPWPPQVFRQRPPIDVVHSHANSLLMHWAPMMRELHGIPCVNTNTIYLPAFAQHLLPNKIYKIKAAREFWSWLAWTVERSFARVYNSGDGLIVQCQGLENYWKNKGLEVPLHVIPRPIDVRIFDQPLGPDPFRADFSKGGRIIVVCRHAREKDIDKVIRAFAHHVLPAVPTASLTLVGDGLEHEEFKQLAQSLGVGHRTEFPGEKPHRDTRDFYGHADVFMYASLSETYGQVISEALWCGVPVVAVDDGMGVSFQVKHDWDGLLVPDDKKRVHNLGHGVVQLLTDPVMRRTFGERAAQRARGRVAPDVVYAAYERAYQVALDHYAEHPRKLADHPSPRAKWNLAWEHLVPWTWKHVAMCSLAKFRGAKGYSPPKGVRIDAAPEPLAAVAQSGGVARADADATAAGDCQPTAEA